jgi:hypothetical protein
LSIRATPAGRAPSVATVRRATAVINLTLGVARADTKRMPISTLARISGRAAVKRPNVTWFRIVCRNRFASGGFQPQSQALAFRREWFTLLSRVLGKRRPLEPSARPSSFPTASGRLVHHCRHDGGGEKGEAAYATSGGSTTLWRSETDGAGRLFVIRDRTRRRMSLLTDFRVLYLANRLGGSKNSTWRRSNPLRS